MIHGAGGRASAQLVADLLLPAFANAALARGDDGALLTIGAERLVVATDSHVVTPLFFPGGDIGCLSVHGTINDLAMGAADPLVLTCGLILEAGLPLDTLQHVINAMARAAAAAGVQIVTGDTKVVEAGKGDGVFINTTGIGRIYDWVETPPSAARARAGDVVILSGPIAEHGVAILAARDGLPFETVLESDCAALHGLVKAMTQAVPDIHVLRDPTRGGVAAALNEIAWSASCGFDLDESAIPVRAPVAAACELLGLDPLTVANEGKLLAICAPADADRLLAVMRAHPLAMHAMIIGHATDNANRFVRMRTPFGGWRMVDWLAGDQLPRIC